MGTVPVKILIKRFGRQVDIAHKLNVRQTAIANWVAANRIPPARHARLLEIAREEGIDLTLADLDPQLARVAGKAA